MNTFYAGGGGAGTHTGRGTCVSGTATGGAVGGGAAGGNGGGGAAGRCLLSSVSSNIGNAGVAGTANTGGGGGGGSVQSGRSTNARGGNGGSGVVVISYAYLTSTAPAISVPNSSNIVFRTSTTLKSSGPMMERSRFTREVREFQDVSK